MASETTTTPNVPSSLSLEQITNADATANSGCNRSKNSSHNKDDKYKRRNRSLEKSTRCGGDSSSGSSGDERCHATRGERKHRMPKKQSTTTAPQTRTERHSGYSSSNESSAEDCHQILDAIQPTMETAATAAEASSPTTMAAPAAFGQLQCQLRRRATSGHDRPASEVEASSRDDDIAEWELVDGALKESDVSLTGNESSDDFWKRPDGVAVAQAPTSKTKKSKKGKTGAAGRWSTLIRSCDLHMLALLANSRAEWTSFKDEHRDEVARIRRMRNQCAIGLLTVFIFCGLGGIIFHSVEGAFETYYKCGVKRVKRDFVDTLWSKSHYMREDDWKSLARSKLIDFENQLYDAYEAGMTTYSGQRAWSFLNSFIYCITLVTTIGYGHIAPATTLGRIITIIYSLFGIPMFLILLADYGKLFTRVIKFFWAYVRRLYYTGSCRKVRKTAPVQEVVKGVQLVFDLTKIRKSSASKVPDSSFPNPTSPTDTPALSTYTIDDEFNLPISVAVSILLLYMLSGAALFMKLEKWSFFESFYFVYISVSTIGFGDIVPSSKISVLLCSLVYFVFGLSLTSMCINVITEKLTDSFRQATAKIGATMGMEIAEEQINSLEPAQQNLVIEEYL